jgi:hypothetical protein
MREPKPKIYCTLILGFCKHKRCNKCCHHCEDYDKCEEKCFNKPDKCGCLTSREVNSKSSMSLISRYKHSDN